MSSDAVSLLGKACRFFACHAEYDDKTASIQRLGSQANEASPKAPVERARSISDIAPLQQIQLASALRHNPIDVCLTLAEPVSLFQGNPSQRTYEASWCGIPVHLHVLSFVKRPNPITQLPGPSSPHATVAAALDAPPPVQANMLTQPDMVAVATDVEAALVQLIAEPAPQVLPVLACAKVTCRAHIGSPGDEHVTQRIIAEVHVVTPRVPGLVPLSQWLQERWPQCDLPGASPANSAAAATTPIEAQATDGPAASSAAPTAAVAPTSTPPDNKLSVLGPIAVTQGAVVVRGDGELRRDTTAVAAVAAITSGPGSGPSSLCLGASQPIAEGITSWDHRNKGVRAQHQQHLRQQHDSHHQQQQRQQQDISLSTGVSTCGTDLSGGPSSACLPCLGTLFALPAAGAAVGGQRSRTSAMVSKETLTADQQGRLAVKPGREAAAPPAQVITPGPNHAFVAAGSGTVKGPGAAASSGVVTAAGVPPSGRHIACPTQSTAIALARQRIPLPPPPLPGPQLPIQEALDVLICLAEALRNLHRRGLTHGFLTPKTIQMQIVEAEVASVVVGHAVAGALPRQQSLMLSPGAAYPPSLLSTPPAVQLSSTPQARPSAHTARTASRDNMGEAPTVANPVESCAGATAAEASREGASLPPSPPSGTSAVSLREDSLTSSAAALQAPDAVTLAELAAAVARRGPAAPTRSSSDQSPTTAGTEIGAQQAMGVMPEVGTSATPAASKDGAEPHGEEARPPAAAALEGAAACSVSSAATATARAPYASLHQGRHVAISSFAATPAPLRLKSLPHGRCRQQQLPGASRIGIRAMLSLPAIGPAVLQLQTWGRARPMGLPREQLLWCAPELLNGGIAGWELPPLACRNANGSGSLTMSPLDQSLGCRHPRLRGVANNGHGRHFGDGSYGGGGACGGPITAKRHRCATQLLMGQEPVHAASNSYGITPSCDVYSLGMLMWYLVSGHPPFQHLTSQDQVVRVKEMGSLDEQLPFSSELPLGYVQLARRCWAPLPLQRPAMKAVLSDMRSLQTQLLGPNTHREVGAELRLSYGGSSLGEMTTDSRLSFTLSLPLSSRELNHGDENSLARPPLEMAFGANDALGGANAVGGGGLAAAGPPPPPSRSSLPAELLMALTAPRHASVGGGSGGRLMDDDDTYSDTDRFTEQVDTNENTEISGGGTPYSSPTEHTANGNRAGGCGGYSLGGVIGSVPLRTTTASAATTQSFRLPRAAGGVGGSSLRRPGSTTGSFGRSGGAATRRRASNSSHATAVAIDETAVGGVQMSSLAAAAVDGAVHVSSGRGPPAALIAARSFASRCARSGALQGFMIGPSASVSLPLVLRTASHAGPGSSSFTAATAAIAACSSTAGVTAHPATLGTTNIAGKSVAVAGSSKMSGTSLGCLSGPCANGSSDTSD